MGMWSHCRIVPLWGLLLASAVLACLGLPSILRARAQVDAQPSYLSAEDALDASLQRTFQQANLPTRNLRLITLANDGAVARLRVVVEVRPGEGRLLEENEREIEVHFSEGRWEATHIPPYFAWQFSAA